MKIEGSIFFFQLSRFTLNQCLPSAIYVRQHDVALADEWLMTLSHKGNV
jgi:hypothetical protein